MKKTILPLILLLPILSMSQWQAEMTNSISGTEKHYQVFSMPDRYRYEFTEDGMKGVVIVNTPDKVSAIMLPDKKMVHYTASDGMMSAMNDPVQAYNNYRVYGPEKILGEEEMSGYDCIKKAIFQDDKEFFTQWFSPELDFPVRMQGHWAENTYMKLHNIRDWKPDPSFFMVPEDYIEVDRNLEPVIPQAPPPDQWEQIDKAIPFGMTASRGMEISFPVNEDDFYTFVAENTGDSPAGFILHTYRDGKELSDDEQGPPEYRTKRLKEKGTRNITYSWKAGYTIIINMLEGSMNLRVAKE